MRVRIGNRLVGNQGRESLDRKERASEVMRPGRGSIRTRSSAISRDRDQGAGIRRDQGTGTSRERGIFRDPDASIAVSVGVRMTTRDCGFSRDDAGTVGIGNRS